MSMQVKENFARPKSWLGVTALNNTAANIVVNGQDISFECVSGNIWVNFNGTAVANSTSILLTAGHSFNLNIDTNLSIISDSSGATYQYIIAS